MHRLGQPARLAATLLLSLACASPGAQGQAPMRPTANLPSLGDGGDMPLGEERRLGDSIVRSIYRDPDYLDDATLSEYLQRLWQPLVAAAQASGDITPDLGHRFAWQTLLIRDRSVNAFALPGGYLGVHLGLMAVVDTPDELASVLAHELSHVSQRHIARLLSRQSQQAPWMIAAMVVGVLAASKARNADIGNAAIVGSQAATMQSQLNFSRDMEREADRVGFGVMGAAGFDSQGFVGMFDKLQQASRLNDDGGFPYLRSHPLTTERVADMRARLPASAAPRPSAGGGGIGAGLHALMAARARVLAEVQMDRLRALAQAGRQNLAPLRDPATLALRYSAALAAALLRDPTAAQDYVSRLLASAPSDPQVRQEIRWLALEVMLLTQTRTLSGLKLEALRDEALAHGGRAALVLGARAAVASRDAASLEQAMQRLQTRVALQADDALAWQTLATVAQESGQAVRAARADAEARLSQLDLQGALDRLKSAQSLARRSPTTDHMELSILDARTREVERRVREQFCIERDSRDAACRTER
jgi:beta-barrel assembly-enhancing protease